jgi:hypothetical protein
MLGSSLPVPTAATIGGGLPMALSALALPPLCAHWRRRPASPRALLGLPLRPGRRLRSLRGGGGGAWHAWH